MLFGFIGTGSMGAPVARNLIRAGKTVLVSNRTAAKTDAVLAAGTTGRAAASPADLADCDVVFTCLGLPEHVNAVMLGEKGLYSLLKPGAVHIETSTIDPGTARALAEAAHARGLSYIQCTLGKTPAHAERAEGPLFIGGDAEATEKLADVFKCIGIPVYLGSTDASCAVKLLSNLVGMTNLVVLAEGLRLGETAGIPAARMLELLTDTGARSYQMDVRGPLIAAGDFDPRFALDLAVKDLRLGCEMADAFGASAVLFKTALGQLREASAKGLGAEDVSAVFKL